MNRKTAKDLTNPIYTLSADSVYIMRSAPKLLAIR